MKHQVQGIVTGCYRRVLEIRFWALVSFGEIYGPFCKDDLSPRNQHEVTVLKGGTTLTQALLADRPNDEQNAGVGDHEPGHAEARASLQTQSADSH